jgi:hypothetical protein
MNFQSTFGSNILKLSKQKVLKCSDFFFTVDRVCDAVVGGNFSSIGEYSSTVKNW